MIFRRCNAGHYTAIVSGFSVSVTSYKYSAYTMWTYTIDGQPGDKAYFTKKLCVKRLKEELNFIINNN
jgi:hypothetical protein